MKKILTLMLVVMGLFITSTKLNAEEENKIEISSNEASILANVNDELLMSDYVYRHNKTTKVSLSEVTLTSFSNDLKIEEGKFKLLSKGIHRMLLQYESANFYVYFIVKEADETEYILLDETFEGVPNGKLPIDYVSLGSSGISSERLSLDGTGGASKVLLPPYLKMFSNYIIETDMTIIEANNESRWASVMFRYSDENYFQMAIRQDATLANGVEFAKRINGNWNVTNTKSYSEKLSPAKMYNLKIDVLDSTVTEYMNGVLMNVHEQAFEFKKGDIGFQADGAKAVFDNIKITLPLSYIREDTYDFVKIPTVYQPETKIVNPATVVTPLNNKEELASMLGSIRPATIMVKLDNDLNVLTMTGEKVSSLYNFLIDIDGKVIPAFYLEDELLTEAIAEKLKYYGILDVFVVSPKKEVILSVRSHYEMVRGILDFSNDNTKLSKEQLNNIRFSTNEAQAVAAIINVNVINKEAVNYLQNRGMTVWTTADVKTRHKAILSGVNGIVTPNYLDVFEIYSTFTEVTHVREVFMISHRGLHNGYTNSSGPENSLEVALEAVKHGAKVIEIDIHLTKDEKVVVMHDDSLNRTTGYPFSIKDQLYLDILSIPLIDVSNSGKQYFVPSLEDFLIAFKGTDVVLFVEIKPTNKLLLEKTKELIEQYDMAENINFIAFGAENINDMKEVYPKMSNGYLTGALLGSNLNGSMLNVLTSIVPIKSTLNPSYGPLTKEFTEALTHRGLTVWPWTIDEHTSIEYFYEAGVGGITTNVSDYNKDALLLLKYENNTFKMNIKDTNFQVSGNLLSLSGEKYPYRGDLIILTNEAEAEFDSSGKIVSVKKTGKIEFYTVAQTQTESGKPIYLTSEVMTIEVVKASILRSVWTYVISGTILVGLAAVGTIYFIKRKK